MSQARESIAVPPRALLGWTGSARGGAAPLSLGHGRVDTLKDIPDAKSLWHRRPDLRWRSAPTRRRLPSFSPRNLNASCTPRRNPAALRMPAKFGKRVLQLSPWHRHPASVRRCRLSTGVRGRLPPASTEAHLQPHRLRRHLQCVLGRFMGGDRGVEVRGSHHRHPRAEEWSGRASSSTMPTGREPAATTRVRSNVPSSGRA